MDRRFGAACAFGLLACAGAFETYRIAPDFTGTHLYVTPNQPQVAVEIRLDFKCGVGLNTSDTITVQLPKFTTGKGSKTPGPNIPMGELHISPSIYFEAQWVEGTFSSVSSPFSDSYLVMRVKPDVWLAANTSIRFHVYETSNIQVYCGFRAASELLPNAVMFTNSTLARGDRHNVLASDEVGNGCQKQANCEPPAPVAPTRTIGLYRGACDFCTERCLCYEGFGDGTVGDVAVDCSVLNCPSGKLFAGLPTTSTAAHPDRAECSGAGLCEITTGICVCFTGFTGDACQRTVCKDDCSGHGKCLTIGQVAHSGVRNALPLNRADDAYYGDITSRVNEAWDFDTTQACVCDSRWTVGLGAGETQLAEYFGGDCSLKHCPSGRDPSASTDGLDCANKTAPLGRGKGGAGNLCHVECSNRGKCNYEYGTCECYDGYIGYNCDRLIDFAGAVT